MANATLDALENCVDEKNLANMIEEFGNLKPVVAKFFEDITADLDFECIKEKFDEANLPINDLIDEDGNNVAYYLFQTEPANNKAGDIFDWLLEKGFNFAHANEDGNTVFHMMVDDRSRVLDIDYMDYLAEYRHRHADDKEIEKGFNVVNDNGQTVMDIIEDGVDETEDYGNGNWEFDLSINLPHNYNCLSAAQVNNKTISLEELAKRMSNVEFLKKYMRYAQDFECHVNYILEKTGEAFICE